MASGKWHIASDTLKMANEKFKVAKRQTNFCDFCIIKKKIIYKFYFIFLLKKKYNKENKNKNKKVKNNAI